MPGRNHDYPQGIALSHYKQELPLTSGHRASLWAVIKCSARNWAADRASTIGAALAFYCAFSLAPLLIIVVTIAGWIIGTDLAFGQLGIQ